MTDPRPGSPRVALGWTVVGVGTVVSYAAQRLWAASDPAGSLDASIVASVHIPYYWRVATAVFHGVIAGALTAWGLRDPEAERLLASGPWWVVGLVLSAAIAMLVVP